MRVRQRILVVVMVSEGPCHMRVRMVLHSVESAIGEEGVRRGGRRLAMARGA